MSSLKLICDMESLSCNTRTKRIYGNVFLDLNGTYYPFKDWNDFILDIISTWAYNLINYDEGTLYFFDGPYEIDFQKDGDTLYLSIEDLGKYNCELKYFLQIIRDALIKICNIEEYSQILKKKSVMSCVQMIDNNILRISESI